MEEAIELVYRIRVDHGGRLSESEAREFDPWVEEATSRAQALNWLVVKESPPVLKVTHGGRQALDAVLGSRKAAESEPNWFGGSIPSFDTPHGPVIPPRDKKPYKELRKSALERGILTQEDIDRVAQAPARKPEEPGEFRVLKEMSFPGTFWFATSGSRKEIDPHGGKGQLEPAGYEGPYQVTMTLTRRGAPYAPFLFVADAYAMEGDSHLWLPQERREDGAVRMQSLVYVSGEGEETHFELLANQQGRLGRIRTVLQAKDIGEAKATAYRLLDPFLCDLSYRYEVPIEVLQTNIVELATLTASGEKVADFHEKIFDAEEFLGSSGMAYETLPHYHFFTGLYREGVNSSSVDYGFLCFFRMAEGVMKWRRKRILKQEGRKVSFDDVVQEGEFIEGEDARLFPAELQGKSLWAACKKLYQQRHRVAHAFLDREDPVSGHVDIIADRLEVQEEATKRRAQAQYIARRMLESEYWPSIEAG
jgi:hypothetical protein